MKSQKITPRVNARLRSWLYFFFVHKQLIGCCEALAKLSSVA
jgi:hypothetical protein